MTYYGIPKHIGL